MAEDTAIEWTDHTVNFWWGCTKVGPGCDHCYAEAWDKRTGGTHWGPHADRRWIKSAADTLARINNGGAAFRAEHGRFPRVFLHSMSDIFDNAVPRPWFSEAISAITWAVHTRPILLTKRVGNVARMMTEAGFKRWPGHAGLMISVVKQEEADRDVLKLLDLKAKWQIPWVGLSIEPMLGPVDLTCLDMAGFWVNALTGEMELHGDVLTRLDWIICGGESGHHARPLDMAWARQLRDQCAAADTAFFMKQMGGPRKPFAVIPEDLMIRQFPAALR